MLGTILVVLLILVLLGALPRWSHSRRWGYVPTGGVGSLALVMSSFSCFSGVFRPLVEASNG